MHKHFQSVGLLIFFISILLQGASGLSRSVVGDGESACGFGGALELNLGGHD